LYVAAALRERVGATIEVVDAPTLGLGHDQLASRVRAFQPDVVGISTLTFYLPDALRLAETVKGARFEIELPAA
jgi:hypothetical protein